MGEIIEFPSNGGTASGYLALSGEGAAPGIVVIQEWWGLVPHIKDVCDRFAAAGFTALAPDLFHGQETTEPDEAGKLMMSLNIAQAGKDMSGAVDYLAASDHVRGAGIGVTGYCMGGGLALVLACQRPDRITAVAPFYGLIPWPDAEPDWSALAAVVQGHYAENDGYFSPDKVHQLEATLAGLGKPAEFFIYPRAEHAFFNDTRPEVYDAEASHLAWQRTVDFFNGHLG